MESIRKYLQDPSWWFSAFFVALVTSIVAGFIKDYLQKQFEFVIGWSKTKRQERLQERENLLQAWSESGEVLLIALLKTIIWLLFYFTLTGLIVAKLTFLKLKYNFSVTNLAVLPDKTIYSLGLIMIVFCYYSFSTANIVFRCSDTIRLFCTKKGISPFIPLG